MRKFPIILFLFALAGCFRVGPDYVPPEAPVQEDWTVEEHVSVQDCAEFEGWWTNYQDEQLNSLVAYAQEANYSLEAAAYRILAARANLGIAIGEFFPQTQQLEGSSIRTHISANAPNTLNASRDFVDNILGFRVAWELDFWGRFRRGIEAAGGEYSASIDDFLDVRRLLVSDLVLAYVENKTLQSRIETLDRNIAIQYRSVEIAKVRWEGGYESELDYAQALTLWKETLAQKDALQILLKRVTTTLAILVGMTPEEFMSCFPIDGSLLAIPDEAVVGFPAEILSRRPDLRRTLDLLHAQCARVGVAVSDLFPRISFTGFLGLECASDTHSTANQKGKHFFSRSSLSFFYGPDFAWPILNYGRLENRVKEEIAILDAGISSYRNEVLTAFKEVEDALTFFAKSAEEADNLADSFKSAKRSVDISTLQYKEGLADYTRVLNSLQLQLSAEDALAQSRGNIGLAYAAIYRALGF